MKDFRGLLQLSAKLHGEFSSNAFVDALRELRMFVGAKVAALRVASGVLPDGEVAVRGLDHSEWIDPAEEKAFHAASQPAMACHPMLSRINRANSAAEEPITLLREQISEDDAWYGSQFVVHCCRPAGIDHCIFSAIQLPKPGWVAILELYRTWGSNRLFTERDRAIAHLTHIELARHYRKHPACSSASSVSVLITPRMRHVLKHILEGFSEKEVAAALGLSVHTVHTYCVSLYRRYGVHSRGELMSKFIGKSQQTEGFAYV